MIAPTLLALLGLAAPCAHGGEIASADGRWLARIRKAPGQERVDDRLARWRLSVHGASDGAELWSCAYRHRAVEGRALLSDDGSTFALVSRVFSEARPVVRVLRFGAEVAELDGRAFDLERGDVERTNAGSLWLHEPGDAAQLAWRESEEGRWLGLELTSARGWTRTADVSAGTVHEPFAGEPHVAPAVDPEFAELARPPFVTSVEVPPQALFGVPVRVRVVGTHPTPNWTLGGFELEPLDGEGTSFRIRVLSLPPPANTFQAQVIEGFDGEALLHGLRPGRYEIAARGREEEPPPPRALEVLPGRLRVRLTTTGGIAGVRDSIELYAPGVARARRSLRGGEEQLFHVRPEALDRVDGLLPHLPERPRDARTTIGADFFEHRLEWWGGDGWRAVTVDDGTAKGAVRELIAALRGL